MSDPMAAREHPPLAEVLAQIEARRAKSVDPATSQRDALEAWSEAQLIFSANAEAIIAAAKEAEALRAFVNHDSPCPKTSGGGRCTCGLDDFIAGRK